MYDDDFDDDDYRNARRIARPRPRRPVARPVVVATRPTPVAVTASPMPWAPASSASPVIDRVSGRLKWGFMVDAVAQAIAAMSSLPAAPPVQGDGKADLTNLVKYQEQLAQHAKRDEQLRTLGALARMFLV
jgi:hypothetical protein